MFRQSSCVLPVSVPITAFLGVATTPVCPQIRASGVGVARTLSQDLEVETIVLVITSPTEEMGFAADQPASKRTRVAESHHMMNEWMEGGRMD